jgi:hypothetical protein
VNENDKDFIVTARCHSERAVFVDRRFATLSVITGLVPAMMTEIAEAALHSN